MSYCHVAPVRYGAVALRVGVHLLIVAQRGERTQKRREKGSTLWAPFLGARCLYGGDDVFCLGPARPPLSVTVGCGLGWARLSRKFFRKLRWSGERPKVDESCGRGSSLGPQYCTSEQNFAFPRLKNVPIPRKIARCTRQEADPHLKNQDFCLKQRRK